MTPTKTRVTMLIDADTLAAFRQRAATLDVGYQTLINETLGREAAAMQEQIKSARAFLTETSISSIPGSVSGSGSEFLTAASVFADAKASAQPLLDDIRRTNAASVLAAIDNTGYAAIRDIARSMKSARELLTAVPSPAYLDVAKDAARNFAAEQVVDVTALTQEIEAAKRDLAQSGQLTAMEEVRRAGLTASEQLLGNAAQQAYKDAGLDALDAFLNAGRPRR